MKTRTAGRLRARGNAAVAALMLTVAFSLAAGAVPLRAAASCGDGILDGNEECDPGGLLVVDGNPDNGACTTGNDCFFALSCCKFNCQYVGQGAPCFDGDGCTINDTCDQVGNCGGDAAPEGNSCDDGLFCTLDDTCDANGNCTGSGDPCSGNPECLDVCDEGSHACLSPAGSPCGDPADNECNGADTCDGAGSCQANLTVGGTSAPTTCDDSNDCTADECDGSGGCNNPNLTAGTPAATPPTPSARIRTSATEAGPASPTTSRQTRPAEIPPTTTARTRTAATRPGSA